MLKRGFISRSEGPNVRPVGSEQCCGDGAGLGRSTQCFTLLHNPHSAGFSCLPSSATGQSFKNTVYSSLCLLKPSQGVTQEMGPDKTLREFRKEVAEETAMRLKREMGKVLWARWLPHPSRICAVKPLEAISRALDRMPLTQTRSSGSLKVFSITQLPLMGGSPREP